MTRPGFAHDAPSVVLVHYSFLSDHTEPKTQTLADISFAYRLGHAELALHNKNSSSAHMRKCILALGRYVDMRH